MKDLIQRKLDSYHCQSSEDEENAIREITQEVVLYALGKSNFFEHAVFQGGTCLRIAHNLDRFSEDLDFVLHEPNKDFDIAPFLDKTASIMSGFAYDIEVTGKDAKVGSVKKRFLKDDSIKKVLSFKHYSQLNKKIRIKIELDINPPVGSQTETFFCDFPIDFSVVIQDLPSLFAGKCHALLCRNYVKGRDWYDFLWYVANNVTVNYELLSAALNQVGTWKGEDLIVDNNWLRTNLTKRVEEIDWNEVVADVRRFVRPEKLESLNLWGKEFFLQKLNRLNRN